MSARPGSSAKKAAATPDAAAAPAPAPAAAPAGRVFELSEVNKHNRASDCWIVIHGRVYDVTEFMADHPGGPDAIMEYAGKDCSEPFEDTGHSASAKGMLKKYEVGTLPGGPKGDAAVAARSAAKVSDDRDADHGGSYLSYFVPVLILAGALWYQFVYQPSRAAAPAGQ